MSTFTTVAEYETAILAEIDSIEDGATRRIIQDLISYAKNTEEKVAEESESEAENRPQRPRPDGSENAAYFRNIINEDNLPSESLKALVEDLLQLAENLENQL